MKRLLGFTRYAVVVPALASILGALLLMAQGSIAMVLAVIDSLESQYGLKDTIVEVLTAIDAILLGTVLLVIGYGLYELFIDTDIDVPLWLRVEDLDDLKSKSQIDLSAVCTVVESSEASSEFLATLGILLSQYFSIMAINLEARLPKSFASSLV